VTKDDAQKVVTIISGDKAKTQTYCEIQKLTQQTVTVSSQHCGKQWKTRRPGCAPQWQ
jgi:hypothetical protein